MKSARDLTLFVTVAAILVAGCSPKRIGAQRMADTLVSTSSSFARDDDPEFVRAAAPRH